MSAAADVTTGRRGIAGIADSILDHLGSLSAISLFWCGYALLYAVLRIARSSHLPYDDALSAEVMQGVLLPAYSARNPPLYEWLLWLVQQVFGHGLYGHVVLRGALIAAIGIAMFSTIRALSGDRRLAAAASFSLLSFYWSAWHVHEALTQSLVLLLLILLLLHLLDAFCRRPDALRAIALGAVMGLGILAKWSFSLAVVAAWIALLWDDRGRRAGLSRLALVAAATLCVTAPTLVYLAAVKANLGGVSSYVLRGDVGETHIQRVAQGLFGLAAKLPAFLMPWLIIVAAAFARLRQWPQWKASDASGQLVSRMVIADGVLLVAAVAAFGIVTITERYVYPLGVPLVVAFYLVVAHSPARPELLRWITSGSLALGILVVVLKLGFLAEAMLPHGRYFRETLPYPALAGELSSRGLATAAFVTPDHQLAGNLLELMPEAVSVATATTRLEPPGTYDPSRNCVLIWNERDFGAALPEILKRRRLPKALPPDQRLEIVGSNGGIGAPRPGVWHIVDLGKDSPFCAPMIGTAAGTSMGAK